MATRWLYTPDGKPAYYVKGKWLFSHPDGKPEFYMEENWIYTREGGSTSIRLGGSRCILGRTA